MHRPLSYEVSAYPTPADSWRSSPTDPMAWVRRSEGIVGWGAAARIDTSGPTRFVDADAWWRDLTARTVVRDEVGLPGSGLVAFGSFGFADDPGDSTLIVP